MGVGQAVGDLLLIIQPSIWCEFVYTLPILTPPSLIKIPFVQAISSDPQNNLKRQRASQPPFY